MKENFFVFFNNRLALCQDQLTMGTNGQTGLIGVLVPELVMEESHSSSVAVNHHMDVMACRYEEKCVICRYVKIKHCFIIIILCFLKKRESPVLSVWIYVRRLCTVRESMEIVKIYKQETQIFLFCSL